MCKIVVRAKVDARAVLLKNFNGFCRMFLLCFGCFAVG